MAKRNPAKSGKQFRLAEAVAHGKARAKSMSKKVAREIIKKTPKGLRKKFAKHIRRNPEDKAADAYRDFHGKDPATVITVDTPIHYHGTLAGIGKLEFLEVRACDGALVTIEFGKGVFLSENEKRNQLFITGGDQSVNLRDFRADNGHEWEVLGEATKVGYFTDKKHLIDGGEAVYVHKFGRMKRGKKTPLPTLIYDARNKLLYFAGGGYTIPSEGIDG